jgi:hypothetical protein
VRSNLGAFSSDKVFGSRESIEYADAIIFSCICYRGFALGLSIGAGGRWVPYQQVRLGAQRYNLCSGTHACPATLSNSIGSARSGHRGGYMRLAVGAATASTDPGAVSRHGMEELAAPSLRCRRSGTTRLCGDPNPTTGAMDAVG